MFSCRRFSHNIFIIHFCEVGVDLPAKPLSFVGPRQHGPDFLCLPAPLLAPCSPQSLCPSPSHANTARILPFSRRLCWRLVPRKAFIFRRVAPTWPGFPRPTGTLVGALFPAKPFSSVGPRQHGPNFHGLPVPLLAPCSPQALIPSSGHANMARFSPVRRCPCWRLVPRKAFVLRRATPTWPGFSRLAGALVATISEKKEEVKRWCRAPPFYFFTCYGAGEGNRTLDASLGSSSFAIKLHPQNLLAYYTPITNSRQTFWFDGCTGLINSSSFHTKSHMPRISKAIHAFFQQPTI